MINVAYFETYVGYFWPKMDVTIAEIDEEWIFTEIFFFFFTNVHVNAQRIYLIKNNNRRVFSASRC